MSGKSDTFVQRPVYVAHPSEKAHALPAAELDHRLLRKPPPALHAPSSRNSVQSNALSHQSRGREGSQPTRRDPEKGSIDHQQMLSLRLPSSHTSVAYAGNEDDDFDDDEEDGPKRHAVWILAYLSALAPLLALPIALYTLLTTVLLLVLTPVFLIMKKRPLTTRFYRFLAPPVAFQLGLIYSPYETNPLTGQSAGSIGRLVLVNILSPIYAAIVMVAAWVGGVFWFYTAILGNPDGKEERDDGRDTVLAVRRWWERWLVQVFR